MEERVGVNSSGRRVEPGPEVSLAAPRFDEKSVQRAQPAVPLAARVRRPASSSNLVLVCLVAALAGAFVGVVALTLYQRDSRVASASDARPASESPGGEAEAPRADAPAAAGPADEPAEAETLKAAGVREEPAGRESGAEGDAAGGDSASAKAGEAPAATGDDEAALRGALGEWIAATNARDIRRQMGFYDRQLGAFYLARNVSRNAVRAEKSRVFAAASAVEVRAGEPDISLGPDGRTAVMRFRKRYHIAAGDQSRRGEVLQELRWRRTPQGWKIVGERDLRVLQ